MSRDEIESALLRNRPEELLVAVPSAALYSSEVAWAESVCLRLVSHPHFNVWAAYYPAQVRRPEFLYPPRKIRRTSGSRASTAASPLTLLRPSTRM